MYGALRSMAIGVGKTLAPQHGARPGRPRGALGKSALHRLPCRSLDSLNIHIHVSANTSACPRVRATCAFPRGRRGPSNGRRSIHSTAPCALPRRRPTTVARPPLLLSVSLSLCLLSLNARPPPILCAPAGLARALAPTATPRPPGSPVSTNACLAGEATTPSSPACGPPSAPPPPITVIMHALSAHDGSRELRSPGPSPRQRSCLAIMQAAVLPPRVPLLHAHARARRSHASTPPRLPHACPTPFPTPSPTWHNPAPPTRRRPRRLGNAWTNGVSSGAR